MDEVLEAAEIAGDLGVEGALAWVLRLIGLVALLGGLGLWLLTDMGLLVLPALLMGVGFVLLVAPSILFVFAELT